MSLGSDGYYFVRTRRAHTFWDLPDAAYQFVENADLDDDSVKYVWLGIQGIHGPEGIWTQKMVPSWQPWGFRTVYQDHA